MLIGNKDSLNQVEVLRSNKENKDLKIISYLRHNSRMSLTTISRKTRIPVTTIFDKLKKNEKKIIIKHTSLINFSLLGFNMKVNMLLNVDISDKVHIRDFLTNNKNINSIYRIGSEFDYMVEGIFRDMKESEDFIDFLKLKFNIKKIKSFYVVEDIKREDFLSSPEQILV